MNRPIRKLDAWIEREVLRIFAPEGREQVEAAIVAALAADGESVQ